MAVCLLDQDLLKSNFCGYSLNQVVDIYLANYEDVTSTTIGAPSGQSATGVEVKTITMKASKKWFHIEPQKNTAAFDDSLVVGGNGSKYRTQTLSFNFSTEYTPEMVNVLDALSLGRYIVVGKLTNGSYVMLGRNVPLEATVAQLVAEAAADGNQGLVFTLSADVAEPALPLSDEAIQTVLGVTPSPGA